MFVQFRKRYRNEGSPSPRQSPKRRREHSPDSDTYNSGDDKNERHRLLSQVVRPHESHSLSPSHFPEDRQGRWKEEDRKPERKESSRRYEEQELKEKVSSVDKQREQTEIMESSRTRDLIGHHPSEDRDTSDGTHDDNKKKAKIQKKPIKKKKEDDVGLERGNTETASEDSQVFSPKKGQKKKSVEKKHKRPRGDSDNSDEEAAQQSKKKRGPRTPPITTKEELLEMSNDKEATIEDPQRKEDTAFSDWSDEDVPDRAEVTEHAATAATPGRTPSPSSLPPPPPPLATASGTLAATANATSTFTSATISTSASTASVAFTSEDSHRKGYKARAEKEVPHVTIEDAPHRKTVDQKRSSSLGSNRSNRSHTSGRLRSPSNDSAHRSGDDQSSRKRVLHSGSRDREKTKSLEITGERKSRIDQLKRGEPSRSTSSDRQDSRSHSSRRSSPESDRQVHSRSGSFDSRDRLQERDRYEHERERERERRDTRQREWDRDVDKDWSRSRDRDRLRERERERDKRRDLDRERERLISDSMERDRDRTFESCSQMESVKRSEAKLDSEHEKDLEGMSRDSIALDRERMDKDLASIQGFEDTNKAERTESVEDDESKLDDTHSLGSGAGEGYEPISDDELDEILAGDAEKREDQQDEEKMPDPLDVIDVDWSGLMPKHPKEPREPGAALLKFTPGAVMLRVGISKKLAGSELFTKVKETCQRLLEKPKDTDSLFEHELGALNMAALLRKEERASLLSNLGPCCKALCFRRDSAIRKQLVKNEKGTVKQAYTNAPVVDNELLRLSLRLFKRKTTCHAPGHEKTEDNKLSQSSVQQELCVS